MTDKEWIDIDLESQRMAYAVLHDPSKREEFADRAKTLLSQLDDAAKTVEPKTWQSDIVSECRLDLGFVLKPSPGVSLRLGHAMRKREAIAAKREASRSAT